MLAAGGLAALGTQPARAVGTEYPFCIQGDSQPGLSNCTFTSYEQCQATASGQALTCLANPYYVGGSTPPPVYLPFPGQRMQGRVPPPPRY